MGNISTASTLILNPNFLQSGFFSSNQGESLDLYWNNQLALYNLDRFKLETPLFNSFALLNNPFLNVMPDYAQLFRDNTQAGTRNMNIQVGTVLQGSSDPSAQLLGKQMVQDNLNLGDASQQILAPDVSHLTGANINYGQLFMQAGTLLAGQLASLIGGLAGQIASNAIKAGSSIYNAVSNIKEINTAAKAGAQGLGKAKAGNAMAIAGAVADLAGSFLPEKTEYNGPKGDITQTMDSVYDGISDAAMSFGPVGMMVGGIMKGGKLLGGVMNSVGGGTDGMCVCAGTKVFTSSGKVVNIESLLKEDGIIGWNEKTKQIVPLAVHDFIEPRQKECLEIVLKNGYTLRCSIDHPILSDNNQKAKLQYINGKRIALRTWKFRRADELQVGDFVGLANNIDYWGPDDEKLAYLVGMLIGDGSYGKGSSCRIISADPDTWNYLESNNLGVLNHCDDSRPEKYTKEVRTYRIVDGMTLLQKLGIAYLVGQNKTLPKNIGSFTKDSVCKLLAGLFDTDGSISVNREKQQYSITLYLSNKSLLDEVRIQLHKLGIFSTIGTRKAVKYKLGGNIINSNESYRLEIHDIASAIAFYNLIPLNVSYKRDNLAQIYEMLKDKKQQEHNDISGAKLVKIVSITPIGLLTVYNLQADYDHTYLANCIITHNTTTDAILGSSFLNLTPIGLINGFGGQKAETITKNEEAFETVGASYTGSNQSVNAALQKSGKKYGLLSSGARKKANEEILEARRQQEIITDIADQATDRFAIRNAMADINGNRRALAMQGGYNLAAIRVGRNGMVITKRVASKYKTNKRKLELQGADPFNTYLQSLPENQRDTIGYRVRDYWEFNGRPKNFGEAIAKGMFTFEDDNLWHGKSVAENPNTGEIEFMKPDTHPTHQLEVDWYNSDDGAQFRLEYELIKSSPYWKYVRRNRVEEFKEGGKIDNVSILVEVDIDSLPEEFKDGGVLGSNIIKEVEIEEMVEEFKEGGKTSTKNRTLEELIKYAKLLNPRFILRMSEPVRDVDLGNGFRGTHRLSWGTTDNPNEAIVYPEIFENESGELIYDPEHAFDNAIKGDMLIMTPEEAEIFTKGYKLGWPEFFQKYAEGGKFNVIPEGALHARLHHMENAENLTKKGIPVVSEKEGGELEQHAEIEKEEIILRLSLTKRLEELAKEDTDEAALEAGKILVEEILNNTVDNTNTLL